LVNSAETASLFVESHYKADVAGKPIEVKFLSKSAGKAVFATQSFEYGETLFVEIPAVSHKFVKKEPKIACSHCLKSFLSHNDFFNLKEAGHEFAPSIQEKMTENSFIYCEKCSREPYCSKECLGTAWESYHQVLCPGQVPNHPFIQLEELAM
jgi:hypothetical protein